MAFPLCRIAIAAAVAIAALRIPASFPIWLPLKRQGRCQPNRERARPSWARRGRHEAYERFLKPPRAELRAAAGDDDAVHEYAFQNDVGFLRCQAQRRRWTRRPAGAAA